MALIKCNECKKEISSTAKQCPSCGYKIKKVGFFWPIIFWLILFGYFFGDEEESSKKVKVKEVTSYNQVGRDNLQKQYWDPGYVEAGFWHTKKFVIKIKSPPRREAAKIFANVVCQQAKEDYNTKGFEIFIMGFDQEVYGHTGCY